MVVARQNQKKKSDVKVFKVQKHLLFPKKLQKAANIKVEREGKHLIINLFKVLVIYKGVGGGGYS